MERLAEIVGIITVAIIVAILVWLARDDFGGTERQTVRRKKVKMVNVIVQIILYGLIICILYILWRACRAARWGA